MIGWRCRCGTTVSWTVRSWSSEARRMCEKTRLHKAKGQQLFWLAASTRLTCWRMRFPVNPCVNPPRRLRREPAALLEAVRRQLLSSDHLITYAGKLTLSVVFHDSHTPHRNAVGEFRNPYGWAGA